MAGPSGLTPNQQLPYPTPDDNVDVPRDIQALATRLDALNFVPPGCMMMWLTSAPPSGWLLCQGQANVSAATNPILASLLGQTAGNVNMPDLQGRIPLGSGGAAAIGGPYALGVKGGEHQHTLLASETGIRAHNHSGTTGNEKTSLSHSHNFTLQSDRNPAANPNASVDNLKAQNHDFQVGVGFSTTSGGPAVHKHDVTVDTLVGGEKSGAPHGNMPPYQVVNYIIKGG